MVVEFVATEKVGMGVKLSPSPESTLGRVDSECMVSEPRENFDRG